MGSNTVFGVLICLPYWVSVISAVLLYIFFKRRFAKPEATGFEKVKYIVISAVLALLLSLVVFCVTMYITSLVLLSTI